MISPELFYDIGNAASYDVLLEGHSCEMLEGIAYICAVGIYLPGKGGQCQVRVAPLSLVFQDSGNLLPYYLKVCLSLVIYRNRLSEGGG